MVIEGIDPPPRQMPSMAAVTNHLASRTACSTGRPFAIPAAMAALVVQPVPCVETFWMNDPRRKIGIAPLWRARRQSTASAPPLGAPLDENAAAIARFQLDGL